MLKFTRIKDWASSLCFVFSSFCLSCVDPTIFDDFFAYVHVLLNSEAPFGGR